VFIPYSRFLVRLETCSRCDFIKTTSDTSLDSQISLLPLGFSPSSVSATGRQRKDENRNENNRTLGVNLLSREGKNQTGNRMDIRRKNQRVAQESFNLDGCSCQWE
jgi:hypothetical protein